MFGFALRLVLVAAFVLPTVTVGQNQYNHWYFGLYVGLDFSSNPPSRLTSQMHALEGSASISDERTGKLLLYTNGEVIWNANHELLPSLRDGGQIGGTETSTQSSIIVRKPGSKDVYFVFAVKAGTNGDVGTLFYSVVDMTLDGGKGDITIKSILLLDSISEKATAIYDKDRCRFWIVSHHAVDNRFFAYALDESGLDTIPVVSAVGSSHYAEDGSGLGRGTIVGSPDGKRVAISVVILKYLELLDFDLETGMLSSAIQLPGVTDEYYQWYGLAFSPDGSKLYATRPRPVQSLVQYDLSIYDATAIANSRYVVTTTEFTGKDSFFSIMPGPDGKLYVTVAENNYLSVIDSPSFPGAACNFRHRAVEFSETEPTTAGLPNIIASYMDGPCDADRLASIEVDSCAQRIYDRLFADTLASVSIVRGAGNEFTIHTSLTGEVITSVEVANALWALELRLEPEADRATIRLTRGMKFIRIRTLQSMVMRTVFVE